MAEADLIATSVFVRTVPASTAAEYERWLESITHESSQAPGNLGTTILRPEAAGGKYIAITSFKTADDLQSWLESPNRAACLDQLSLLPVRTEKVEHQGGLARWFAEPGMDPAPPKHKIAILLVLGLFPIVMLLQPLASAMTPAVPFSVRTLMTLSISVCLMVWLVMPFLTRITKRWLQPPRVSYSSYTSTT